MSKRKFNYIDFNDGYGTMFDAGRYTQEQAKEIYLKEYRYTDETVDLSIDEDWVRWVGNVSKEERYYFDMECDGVQGTYMSCDKEDKGSFKCWRVREQ